MNKFRYILFVILISLISSCSEDDNTGDSELTPSNPIVNIDIAHPTISLVEKDSTFTFPITLSEPQISDVIINVSVSGDAAAGEDFTFTNQVIIPASRTSGKAVVNIKADDIPEDTETFTVTIGDATTANAQLTPQEVNFTIMNVSEGDLPVEFYWSSEYYYSSGKPIPAEKVGNINIYVYDENGDVLDVLNSTESFESFVMTSDSTDRVYTLKAKLISIIDPGDIGDELPEFDLYMDFSQVGAISPTTFNFPGIMDGVICDWNEVTLATITKSGTDYTVTKIGEFDFNLNNFTGEVETETDIGDFTSEIEVNSCYSIVNHNYQDTGEDLIYDIDPVTHKITVDPQDILGGAYTVSGSGTYDPDTYEITLTMDLVDNSDPSESYLDVKEVYTP